MTIIIHKACINILTFITLIDINNACTTKTGSAVHKRCCVSWQSSPLFSSTLPTVQISKMPATEAATGIGSLHKVNILTIHPKSNNCIMFSYNMHSLGDATINKHRQMIMLIICKKHIESTSNEMTILNMFTRFYKWMWVRVFRSFHWKLTTTRKG